MCHLNSNQVNVANEAIRNFAKQREPFTSVHVANVLKAKGEWIKNRHVASFLREDVDEFFEEVEYTRDMVSLTLENGKRVQTFLYYPSDVDVCEYDLDEVVAQAMTPTQFSMYSGTNTDEDDDDLLTAVIQDTLADAKDDKDVKDASQDVETDDEDDWDAIL